jgi:predicted enzyme related to lactoylglutathione lyase
MGERTSHPPGTLSWADLTTSDAAAAKRFYGELLGWRFDDLPVGDGQIYSMARVNGLEVAALSQAADQPPHWNLYVTVEAADRAAARAKELGANVLAEPFDVLDAGRMAVIQDPTGAILCVWEPRGSIGARLVNTPGAMTWADVLTPDPDAAARFYGDWLGWSTQEIAGAEGYRVISNGERSNGGMQPLRPEVMGDNVPPNWFPYFGVEDLDAARARAEQLGARTIAGPIPVPQGAFAVMMDPQGAVFAIWSGEYDD